MGFIGTGRERLQLSSSRRSLRGTAQGAVPTCARSGAAVGFPVQIRVFLGSLLAAQRGQRGDYFGRPLGYFIFTQRSFGGLEFGAQQHGILAGGDRAAPEDLDG